MAKYTGSVIHGNLDQIILRSGAYACHETSTVMVSKVRKADKFTMNR